MVTFREVINNIKANKVSDVYILSGEEPYYLDKIVETLEASVVAEEDKEFDQSVMYGADSNAAMVLEAASRFPMLSEKRLVILKEAQSMPKAKTELQKLKTYVANPNPSTILCIVFKGDKLDTLAKSASGKKNVTVFESPKIVDWKITSVVKDYCFAEKIKIEERGIEVLTSNVGTSLTSLFSEIEKLRVALGDKDKSITAEDVMEHIGLSKEFNNFELVNALALRDYFKTIQILKNFESNPKNNPTPKALALIFKFYQQLLLCTFDKSRSEKSLMDMLGIKSQYAFKDIKSGLMNYNAAQTVEAIHAIREFDTKSKGIDSMQKEYPLFQELLFRLLTL